MARNEVMEPTKEDRGWVGPEFPSLGRIALGTLLFAVKPFDPISFAVATLGVGTVAIAACVAPALRAVRSDPATALRAE